MLFFSLQDQETVYIQSKSYEDHDNDLIKRSLDIVKDADVCISLNALQGVAGGSTLQMQGMIKKQVVPFLMDTGSTHNFISANWVKTLGLKSQNIQVFSVTVASDKQLVITKKCSQVQWKFNDLVFFVDFLVLPSSTFGVILGMQWFRTLGEISWNCAQLTMKFEHQGKMVCLQGEQASTDMSELTARRRQYNVKLCCLL